MLKEHLAGPLALLVPPHPVGDKEVKHTVVIHLDGQLETVVAEQDAAHRDHILVVVADRALLAEGLYAETGHSTLKLVVAMVSCCPFLRR